LVWSLQQVVSHQINLIAKLNGTIQELQHQLVVATSEHEQFRDDFNTLLSQHQDLSSEHQMLLSQHQSLASEHGALREKYHSLSCSLGGRTKSWNEKFHEAQFSTNMEIGHLRKLEEERRRQNLIPNPDWGRYPSGFFHDCFRLLSDETSNYSDVLYYFALIMMCHSRSGYEIMRENFPLPSTSAIYDHFRAQFGDIAQAASDPAQVPEAIAAPVARDPRYGKGRCIAADAISCSDTFVGAKSSRRLDNSYMFLINLQPLIPGCPCHPILIVPAQTGSANQTIRTLIDFVVGAVKANGIPGFISLSCLFVSGMKIDRGSSAGRFGIPLALCHKVDSDLILIEKFCLRLSLRPAAVFQDLRFSTRACSEP
jgi:hypothetical protein